MDIVAVPVCCGRLTCETGSPQEPAEERVGDFSQAFRLGDRESRVQVSKQIIHRLVCILLNEFSHSLAAKISNHRVGPFLLW